MRNSFLLVLAALATPAFALPAVGPDYHRPDVAVPSAYRDGGDAGPAWKLGLPADAERRGAWWHLFGDPRLDALEERATVANQDLRAAAARVVQARAAAGFARGAFWPQLAVGGAVVREQTSSTTDNVLPTAATTTYEVPVTASWEIDLFGRVRRLNESARNDAAAAAATFEAVRLSLSAEVASTYFALGALERERTAVQRTVQLRQRALELGRVRLRNGTAADVDVARAETELASAEADAAELARRVATVQDALAVLVGVPAPGFTVEAATAVAKLPTVPAGLPAELLERRPDVAAAERALAAANARIGVAKAAFFPAISLTGSAGFASGDVDRLFRADSRIWSIGPALYLPIFQGGRNRANLDRAHGAYEEAVAAYRQRVLIAFREVQDSLSGLRYLAEQSAAQGRALDAATRAARLAQVRYDAGYVPYLEVIDAQRTALAVERGAVQVQGQQAMATVALIKALGGGWRPDPRSGAVAVR